MENPTGKFTKEALPAFIGKVSIPLMPKQDLGKYVRGGTSMDAYYKDNMPYLRELFNAHREG